MKKKRWTAEQRAQRAAEIEESKRSRIPKAKPHKPSPFEKLQQCIISSAHTGSVRAEGCDAENLTRIVVRTACQKSSIRDHSCGYVLVQPLIIFDLNGVLCHRIRKHREPEGAEPDSYRPALEKRIVKTVVIPRPNLHTFLRWADQNFCVAVWTSAKLKTARQLVEHLFPEDVRNRLLFLWGQDRCQQADIPSTESCVPLFYKDLKRVWEEFPLWSSHNTIIVDDSPEKCQRWIGNAIHPLPLNGRNEKAFVGMCPLEEADEDNCNAQEKFLHRLLDFYLRRNEMQPMDVWTTASKIPSVQELVCANDSLRAFISNFLASDDRSLRYFCSHLQ